MRIGFVTPVIFSILWLNLSACGENELKSVQTASLDPSLCAFSRGECVKQVGGATLRFSLSPAFAPSEKPIEITMSSTMPIDKVNMRLEGRDMFMGVIPVNISKVDENTYLGKFIYGSCSSGYMVWRGFVNVTIEGEQHSVIIDFLADSDH